MRQLNRPALLVATYKGDATGIATAAMEEVEKPLTKCLHELERLVTTLGGGPRPSGHCWCLSVGGTGGYVLHATCF